MFRLLLLASLSMSVGWGFRGDYGHETGAILPGALLALSLAMAAGRADWLARATLLAFCGGFGWALGGQMSYGLVIGYTLAGDGLNVAYGYAGLFLIGALWGGIGAAVLALGLTWPRRELARFAWPLALVGLVWEVLDLTGATDWAAQPEASPLSAQWAAWDVDWVAALSALVVGLALAIAPALRRQALLLALLSAGWQAGLVVLVDLAGLRLSPPRSDNWAGCVGLFAVLCGWLRYTRQFAALRLAAYGFLFGGLGFSVGSVWMALGQGGWWPVQRVADVLGKSYWKWMEQFFGLVMGGGVAAGAHTLIRGKLAPVENDAPRGPIDVVALAFLLIVMPWATVGQNVGIWHRAGWLPDRFAGVGIGWVFLLVGAAISLVMLVAVGRHQRGRLTLVPASPLGRAQALYLLLLWGSLAGDLARVVPELNSNSALSVQLGFWLMATITTLVVLSIDPPVVATGAGTERAARDAFWRIRPVEWASLLIIPVVIAALTLAALAVEDEAPPHARRRFVTESPPPPPGD